MRGGKQRTLCNQNGIFVDKGKKNPAFKWGKSLSSSAVLIWCEESKLTERERVQKIALKATVLLNVQQAPL